jgi:hypothetical protein
MFDDLGDDDRRDIFEGGCWITGGGHIGDDSSFGGAGQNDQDSFGFNAMGMKDGRVRGELQNTTHLGDVFHGHATWIICWKDDGLGPEVPRAIPNNAAWGGHGSWNHVEGYAWEAHLADHAEGGSHMDEYELWITADPPAERRPPVPGGRIHGSRRDLIFGTLLAWNTFVCGFRSLHCSSRAAETTTVHLSTAVPTAAT